MDIHFKQATLDNIPLAIELQNSAFYQDYVKYGKCPSYNQSEDKMRDIILNHHDFIIYADDIAVGNMIVKLRNDGECHLSSLGIIPEYQNKGIGKKAIKFLESHFSNALFISLDTPSDKRSNQCFYEKTGFSKVGESDAAEIHCILYEKTLHDK